MRMIRSHSTTRRKDTDACDRDRGRPRLRVSVPAPSVATMTGTQLVVREHIDLLRVASALCR
jgi:hypothetical protein